MNDLQRYLVHEFVEDYKDGYLSRRDMMKRVLYITGGVAATATLLSSLGCGTSSSPATPQPVASSGPTGSGGAAAAANAPRATPGGTPGAAATGGAAASAPTAAAGATPAATPAVPTPAAPSAAASPSAAPSGGDAPKSPLSVPANDPSIVAGMISFPGNGGTVLAYQARPQAAPASSPVVLVCHENRGLTPHIEDVARRFAKNGYVACAVDLLSPQGGTDKVADPAQVPALLSKADPAQHVAAFQAAVDYYRSQGSVNADRVGMTGYCFGGGITWIAATAIPTLKAAVPFYGPPPPLDAVPKIKAAVLGVYSSDPGDFANKDRDKLEQALKAAGVTYEFRVYPNTQHAFNNDTGSRYNQEQALAAWKDTLDWFAKYLKA